MLDELDFEHINNIEKKEEKNRRKGDNDYGKQAITGAKYC